ncbi:FG-GAP-like repeat-containing protein [Polaromonas sp. P1-6]|nr:FG-GAP-like repeat-containing protein [Polaromonas sp. P1-6]
MSKSVHLLVSRAQVRFALMLVVILVASLVGGALVTAATQAPTFVRTDYPLIGNNHVAGDFNGDGRLDLAGIGAKSAKVQLANGDGTFGAAVEYPVASWSQDLAAGDFNGDGKLDLVATINDPQISLSLLTGKGDGTFNAAVNFSNTSGFDSPAVVATDLNNDGKLDVVIGHQIACFTAPCIVARTITVMRGNGDGTFQPAREIDIGTETAKIAVGDFNRDGIKDLAIASSRSRVCILLGVGDGTFNQQPTLTLITENNLGMDATDIDVADFNRDTLEDLVVAVALNGSKTAILTGNSDGTFRQPPLLITEPNISIPQQQAVGDFNGDGFPDLALALADGSFGLMEILNGNGDGTFQPPVFYLKPPAQSSLGGIAIISANLNSDNKTDIVLGIGGASPGTAVLINSTGVAPVPTPSAPTLLSPANGATVAQPVTFDWNDVANATSYEIQVDDSSTIAAPFRASQIVSVSQATIGGLPAQRLWWRVRGINSASTAGAWSSVRRFTPQAPASAPALSAIALSPTSVVGGNTSQGTATLTSAAPPGGAVVALSSSNTSTATVPASVTVAAGATSASFTVNTVSVTASTPVTIGGTFGGAARSATLTVVPLAAPAALSAVSVNPTSITGGASAQGTLTLTSAAPAGGFAVSLSSTSTAAAVPASVSVAPGATSTTFAIPTSAVTTSTPVTITASAGGVTRTAALTVNPPAQTATLTVTATGRSGERVISSPAGINVTVGSSGSASFATGTAITLSATNGRDTIWSGACSSGGNKTKTCTFTLSGIATVTANVQ